MSRGSLFAILGSIAGLLLLGFALLGVTRRNPTHQGAPVAGSEAVAPTPSEPSEAPDSSGAGIGAQGAPASRRAAVPQVEIRRTARVEGRLVLKGGGSPLGGPTVTIHTGDRKVDAPDTWARMGMESTDSFIPWASFVGPRETRRRARLAGGWKYVHRAVADRRGAFSIAVPPDLPRFRFVVEGEILRYRDGDRWYDLDSPEVREGVVLELEPAGQVEGRIVGPGGKPVACGEVTLVKEESRRELWQTGDSDAEGKFVIRGVSPGRYAATASGEGCCSAITRGVEVRVGESTRVDLELSPESFVAGLVVDAKGRGIAGAKVAVDKRRVGSGSFVEAYLKTLDQGEGMTDGRGAFRIGGLREDSYRIWVTREGMLSPGEATTVAVPSAEGIRDLRIVLEEGRALAGRVVDESGNPVAQASVSAHPDPRNSEDRSEGFHRDAWQSARTGVDGRFRLTGLADVPQEVSAGAEGFARMNVRLVGPGTKALSIILPRAASVSGVARAADTGEPVTNLDVIVQSFSDGRLGGPGRASHLRSVRAPEGRFELAALDPVPHSFTFRARGFLAERTDLIELTPGEARAGLEITLRRGGSVRGTVVEKATRTPLAGMTVTPEEEGRPDESFLLRQNTRPTGPDGDFELDGLEPGTVRLFTRQGILVHGEVTVELRAGETVAGVVLEVSRGGGIEGVYFDGAGSPLNWGRVSIAPAERRAFATREVSLGEGGAFRVDGLAAGRYRLQGRSSRRGRTEGGETNAHAVVEVEDGRVARVELRPETRGRCTVRGRVVHGEVGVDRARVFLARATETGDPALLGLARERGGVWTARDGAYSIEGVRPGSTELVVETHWGSTLNAFPIVVPDSDSFTFDASIPRGEIEGKVVCASDGKPVTGCMVFATPFPSDSGRPRAWVSGSKVLGEGAGYGLRDLAPGAYFVSAIPESDPLDRSTDFPGLAGETRGPIELGEDAPLVVDFALREGGSVVVTVVDEGGVPVRGATTYVFPVGAAESPHRFYLGAHGRNGPYGSFRADRLPSGPYVAAVVEADGRETPSEPFSIRKGEVASVRVEVRR